MDTALAHILIAELKGIACRCGKTKKANQTFCYRCYSKLPKEMQQDLYKRVGSGYEEAYQAAVGKLGI